MPLWLEDTSSSSSASSSSVSSSSSSSTSSSSKKKEVIKNIQRWCNDYCNAGLKVDGIYGPKTKKGLCKALQHYLNKSKNAGLTENGIFGAKTKAACITASGKTPLVYICQAMLYCKGYNMSNSISNNKLDGIMGQGTKKQILLYQQNTRGLRHDGCCGAATFYAMFNS